VKLLVIAKAPKAGEVKTRLSPPCTPQEAATLATASLMDTMAAVAATPAVEPVLVLEGEPGPWLHPAFTVVPQRGRGLDERLAAAFEDAGSPALLIGMDTPQVTPEMLAETGARLEFAGTDAVFGPAQDGGFWAIGLRRPDPRVFLGVPMSSPRTGSAQLARLADLELSVGILPTLRDVDDLRDAIDVAALAPATRFAAAVAGLDEATLAASRTR
jgi:uncharacterized protein